MGAVEGAPPAAMGRYQRQSRRDALYGLEGSRRGGISVRSGHFL